MTEGLLLVHAFPVDASMWEPQMEAFGRLVRVVAPHLPGFGGTPPADEVMTMAAAARRLVEELDRAGVDRAVVCGLSVGGYVAFELWRSHRERVAGMVLANTKALPDDAAGKERRRQVAERAGRDGVGFLVEEPGPLLSDRAPEALWERVKAMIAAQSGEAVAAAALGMAERPDSTGDLPGIDVPTLVVTSTGDTLIPAEASRLMAEAIRDAGLEVIEGAGHLSNLEAPEEFNRALESHLARCGLL